MVILKGEMEWGNALEDNTKNVGSMDSAWPLGQILECVDIPFMLSHYIQLDLQFDFEIFRIFAPILFYEINPFKSEVNWAFGFIFLCFSINQGMHTIKQKEN